MSEKKDLTMKGDLLYSPLKRYKDISSREFFRTSSEEQRIHKEKILKHLNAFDAVLFTSAKVYDEIEKKYINDICDNTFFDGVYEWTAKETYHFKKYNMPLYQDFIEHCLKD